MKHLLVLMILLLSASLGKAQTCMSNCSTQTWTCVPAGTPLQPVVASKGPGTTFCLEKGVHTDFDVLNTGTNVDGDTFTGEPGR
jgi:hypothetical protein